MLDGYHACGALSVGSSVDDLTGGPGFGRCGRWATRLYHHETKPKGFYRCESCAELDHDQLLQLGAICVRLDLKPLEQV